MSKSPDAFRTISEVADWLGIQAHVLRFWESKFPQVKPVKRAGGRRYYRPVDMLLLGGIKKLLHDDGLTIKGVQKIIREQGVEYVSQGSRPLDSPARDDLGAPGTLPKVVRLQKRASPPTPAPDPASDQTPAPETTPETTPETAPESAPKSAPESVVSATIDADMSGSVPEPVPDIASPTQSDGDAGPGPETGPETAPALEEAAEKPVAPPPRTAPDQPSLPSFLHRPAPVEETTAGIDPDPAPPPAASRPRQIEIADPPPEDELPYRPGPLAKLARIRSLSANQAAEIAPVMADLRVLFGRLSGHPPV